MDTCTGDISMTLTSIGKSQPGSLFPELGKGGRLLTSTIIFTEYLTAAILAVDVLIVFSSVVYRYFLHSPINWAEEIASALMGALVFFGAPSGLARGKHSGLDSVRRLFPRAWYDALVHLSHWIIVAVAAGLLVACIYLDILSADEVTPIGLPEGIFIYPPTIGSCILLMVALAKALVGPKKTIWSTLVGSIAVAAAVWVWNSYVPDHALGPVVLICLCVIVPLVIGVPIAFALAFASLVYFGSSPSLDISIYSQQLIAGCGHFVLLAIPFFVLAGLAMEANGMSIRLIELLLRMMGRMRGGLNVIIVVASAFFSGISGSKNADIAAIGGVIMPAIRRTKQDPSDAAGLLAASAIMSETIPPCINIIVFGFVANVSIAGLFVAGLVPAAVLALALIAVAIYFGKRINPDEAFETRKPMLHLIGGGMVGLIMIVMIGRGVMVGVATSTEISAFAVVYAFVVGAIAFRELTWNSTVRLFMQAAGTTTTILFIVAAASALAYSLTIEQIPQDLSSSLIEFGTQYGQTFFLIAASILMIVFGSILEGAPALIVFGPLLTPVAQRLGIDSLHFGIITVLAMGTGLCSPPLGIGLYTTCAVTGTTIKDVSRAMVKYLIILLLGLLLLIIVPDFTLWLPRRWGL